MSRPPMHVTQDLPGGDHELKVLHVLVGVVSSRHVIEHQQNPGRDQDQKQVQRNEAQAQGRAKFQTAAVDLGGLEVKKKAGDGHLRAFEVALGQADPKDRTTNTGSTKAIPKRIEHAKPPGIYHLTNWAVSMTR